MLRMFDGDGYRWRGSLMAERMFHREGCSMESMLYGEDVRWRGCSMARMFDGEDV